MPLGCSRGKQRRLGQRERREEGEEETGMRIFFCVKGGSGLGFGGSRKEGVKKRQVE